MTSRRAIQSSLVPNSCKDTRHITGIKGRGGYLTPAIHPNVIYMYVYMVRPVLCLCICITQVSAKSLPNDWIVFVFLCVSSPLKISI